MLRLLASGAHILRGFEYVCVCIEELSLKNP